MVDGDKPPFFFDSQKVCKICFAFSDLEGQAGEYCCFVPAKKVCKNIERIKVSEQQKSNQRLIGHQSQITEGTNQPVHSQSHSRRGSTGSFNRTPQSPTLPLRWLQSITASLHIFLTLCYLLLSFKMFGRVREAADPPPRFIPPHGQKEPRQENYLLSWFLSLKVCKIRCGGN